MPPISSSLSNTSASSDVRKPKEEEHTSNSHVLEHPTKELKTSEAVCSFDVFDTCLTRVFAQSTGLFFELAKRVLKEKPHGHYREIISELARYRIKTESRVRENHRKGLEEIDLGKIYRHMESLSEWDIDAATMMQAELELELECVRPILTTLNQVRELRKSHRILFISDIYLPEEMVRQMLEKLGFWDPADKLYVSSKVGLIKWSGNLFKHVLE
ncbi:hypothetical protein N9C83_05090 [Opitutales bacterium]|nr:hypothetical protein [Opitutales bacterium]